MTNRPIYRRAFFVLVFALLAIGLLYLASPWVAAFVRHERLKRYIKIETSYPGCIPGKESFDSLRCQCEFIFEGIRTPAEVRFAGDDLRKSFDAGSRSYSVQGTGVISAGTNSVVISSDGISVNGTKLPSGQYSAFHVFIRSDGRLENSRIDIAY